MTNFIQFFFLVCFLKIIFCNDGCPGGWNEWTECKGCFRTQTRTCKDGDSNEERRECKIDPCKCHFKIDDEQRSTAFILKQGSQQYKCDLGMRHFWYRFTSPAGGKMPTTEPQQNACGATQSIWLDGSHPVDIGNETTLQARVVSQIRAYTPWSVKAKKCQSKNYKDETFFIYYLESVPTCPMVYCAGSEKRCPGQLSSKNGFTPGCSDNYPKYNNPPTINIKLQDNKIRMTCIIDPLEKTPNVKHEVSFYQGANNKLIKMVVVRGDETDVAPYVENPENWGEATIFNLGNEFFCQVISYFEDKVNVTGKGSPQKSNVKFAGIKVEPERLVFKSNEDVKSIKIYSTVGISQMDGCSLQSIFHETQDDAVPMLCTKCLTNDFYGRENAWELNVTRTSFTNGLSEHMFIRIITMPNGNLRDWDQGTHEVMVIVNKAGPKRCQATGDPHFTTFDGLYFHMYHVGDYVMMGTHGGRTMVHMRTHVCNGRVSCICGIAVRYGDDVVTIDMCRGGVSVRFPSKKPLNPAFKVTRVGSGRNYNIFTPDGVSIRFDGHLYWWTGRPYYANVYIQTTSDYRDKTFGMCGNNNDDIEDDHMTKDGKKLESHFNIVASELYTAEWKIPRGHSLFYYQPGWTECDIERKKFCSCRGKDTIECKEVTTRSQRWVEPDGIEIHPDDGVATECGGGGPLSRRRRRSTKNVIRVPNDDDGGYDFDPQQLNITDLPTFPTKSGTTRAEAESNCTKAIEESTFGKACLDMFPSLNLTTLVEECVTDIEIMDDLAGPTASVVDSITELCKFTVINEITKNSTSTTNNTASNSTTDGAGNSGEMVIPDVLKNNLCPSDCSGNGKCVNGTCQCDYDFISLDCSIRRNSPLQINSLANGGLCDIRKRDCLRARMLGWNFVDSLNLQSRSVEVEIPTEGQGYTKTKKVNVDDAFVLSLSEIVVEIPHDPTEINNVEIADNVGRPVGGFLVSVSSNGFNSTSNQSLFVVYDGKCLDCKSKNLQICTQKTDTCLVNGYCFGSKEVHPNDWCQICDPQANVFAARKDNKAPIFRKDKSVKAIKGQRNRFNIIAEDPENKTITYSLNVGASSMYKITNGGLLSFTPTEVGVSRVTIRATDICGAYIDQEFTFETLKCPCEGLNGGSCRFNETDRMQLECVCPQGCTGERCDQPLKGQNCKVVQDKDSDEDKTNLYLIIGLAIGGPLLLLVILFLACRLLKHGRVSSTDNQVAMKNILVKEGPNVEQTPVVEINIGDNGAGGDKDGKDNTGFNNTD
eukprot:TCONS_00010074-protein